ncbi:hypothetical protein ABPG74_016327 [Tetrahymena malaccensis]
MDIEKNKDIQVEKSSPEREEDAQQTDFVRITEKLTDVKMINRFNFQLRNSKTNEEKLNDLKVLSETPSPILNRFYSSPGLRTLGEWIYEGSDNITQNSEVLEKIFTLLKEITLKNDHFENAHYLGLGIEKMHIAQQNSENNEALNIFYKFYNLNKSIINDWLESFKLRSQDPNFKRQQLWSEQQKLNVKRSFNTANNNNNMNKYQQKDYNQNKYNQGNNFQKGNNGKYGVNNFQRGDSPPNQKKVKYNNGNAGSTGFNNNLNLNQKPGAKSVRFTNNDQIKRFRKEDEPNMPDLTEEEVEKYQEECIQKKQSDSHIFTSQDMKKRENKLEKESRNQQKESERKERQMLDEMKEDIQWRTPQKLKGLHSQFFETLSSESTEKELHKQRILCKLQSLYGSDAEIPTAPSYENVINDKVSAEQPKQVYLNKIDENDFIQIIEMAIKSESQQQKQKVEKKVLKSILKIPKEEKELQRKKLIQEKKKQAEDEERLKSQINQSTFNQLIDLIMHSKNTRDELKLSVKALGLTEVELQNIYQNINVIKKLWHQRQAVSAVSTVRYGSAGEEKKEQEKSTIPPVPINQHSQQPFNNNFINTPGSNSLTNNQNQQPVMNNSYPASYNQHNSQNTNYNQYRSQQVNPQQNFTNNFNNNNNNYLNNQPKQIQGNNNTFNAQQNNFGASQRFQSNNMPQNNQHNIPPSHSYSQQGGIDSYQKSQDQNQQFHGMQNQNFSQDHQNFYQHPQNNNNFNFNPNNNNNRAGPQTHRPNNQPPISQQNNPSNNQFYPQQNRNFNNNNNNNQQPQQHQFEQNNYGQPNQVVNGNNMQHQQKQPVDQFQQDQGYNNNLGQPSQMIQNKTFMPQKLQQNQQNKPNFNPNVPNQNIQKQIAPPTSGVAQHQNEESKTKHVPCRMYHSAMGCRYDVCNFLHNPEYQGRPVPNMQNKVRPMYALSKNGERNLENTFAYNKANYEKRNGQLNALPFPQAGGISAPPPPPQFNQQQNNQFSNIPQVQQQPIRPQGQTQPQQNSMFIFQQTNPLLKQQQKPQPPQKI